MIISYLIVVKIDNLGVYYGFLGISSRYLFSIFAIILYNNSLFENAKNFDRYEQKKIAKINRLKNILNK